MPTTDLPIVPGVRFAPINGFEGYAVGDDGTVWSRLAWRHLPVGEWRRIGFCPTCPQQPYPAACLTRGSTTVRFTVHTLVLLAFGNSPKAGEVCRHLDGNPSNNRLANLCWGTEAENAEDRRRHGTLIQGSKHKLAKLTESDIPDIIAAVAAGETQASVADRYGVHQSRISRIVNRKRWKHVTITEH